MAGSPSLLFCRDCLNFSDRPAQTRCKACGSPRVLSYRPSASLTIAHLDCDAFYASIEKRDRPDLRDRPVIIGGGTRGVVSTACYIARIRGVKSAMPMFKALKLCPDAVVLRPDMTKYSAVARDVRERMASLTPLVEPISIDEAFLDLSGTEALHAEPTAVTLARLANTIQRDLGITVSVGLSYNKFLAKIASDLGKPRGFAIIEKEAAPDFLRDKPISLIWGVGQSLDNVLRRDGLVTIGQLQGMREDELMKRYGQMGQRLYRLSRGVDSRSVKPRETAKSISSETTFNTDLSTASELLPPLRRLCEKVSRRLKTTEMAAKTVVVKLKSTDFRIRTRRAQLANPTRLADRLFVTARPLLEKELDGTQFRLIGVGCLDFCEAVEADPQDLVDPAGVKRAHAEAALDSLRNRFGDDAIHTGYTFKSSGPVRPRGVRDERLP